jgi:tetratricopeptide (TPR) repeat protein
MPAERIARHSHTDFVRRRVLAVGDAVARESDAAAAAGELPLLGRSSELADLRAAVEESASGRGSLVLLAGEPGIGKTRLASALADHAAAAGHRVAWARGWDGGGAPAFWPWVQVVRAVAADRDDDELRADLGAGARWVAQLAPELRERLGLPEAGDLESEQARFALFDAVTVFLRNAAQREPLLVLLDDLHTADLPSLLLLAFLARSLGESRVVAVTTHHEAGPRRGSEVEAVFGELTRFGRRVELTGLGHDDLRALVVHRSGAEPSEELLRSLEALTDGNPFYSDEVVRLLVAQGRVSEPVDRSRLPLPDSIRDAIRRRLLPLSPEAREALDAAAVEGHAFRLATLERATGTPRAVVLARLEEALAVQLIDEAPGPAGSFRFGHGLIRETLYGDLPATRRALLHIAVGDALERTDASEAELAHHFVEGAAAGDPARALEHAERAGHEALAALAYERAAELFDAALASLYLLPEPDDHRRGKLLLARGQALMQAGGDAARETLRAAMELAEQTGDDELRARAALSLGGFGLSPGIVDEEFVAALEAALERLGPDGSALRARLLVRLAVALYYSADSAVRREELVQEALRIARGLDDPPTLAYVLDQGHIATNGPDTTERGLAWAQELFALADAAGDPELAVRARSWQIDLLLELDDLTGADMAIEALDRIATDSRDPRARAYIPLHRARRATIEGNFEETEALIGEGTRLGWSLQDSTVPILAGAQLFWLRLGQGRLGELEDAVRQFADQLPAMPAWRVALATLYLHTGRPAEARREYERLAERDFATIPRDNVWSVAMALLAELSESFRDVERARVLEELLEPLAHRNVVSPTGIFAGPMTRYLALAAAARGDYDVALERLDEARQACERLGYRPMLAVIDFDEARMRIRRGHDGDVERARELLHSATARAEAVGVPRLGERLTRAEAMLPPQEEVRAPAMAAADGPATGVFAREGDVWRIDYEGRVLHVRDAKGMRHLALLLANPGIEFHAVEVAGSAEGAVATAGAEAQGLAVRAGTGDAGVALDTQAKAEYRARLEDLRADIEEAEAFNDPERAARAREEMDFIAQELSSAVGLGGRDRRAASAAERARVNVTRALKREIRRIGDEDARLGRELSTTVRTGTFCAYEPDPRRPIEWRVDVG